MLYTNFYMTDPEGYMERMGENSRRYTKNGLTLVNHGGKRRWLATVRDSELEEERRAAAASLEDLRQNAYASFSLRTPFRPLRISSPIYIRSAHPDLICVRKFVICVGQ